MGFNSGAKLINFPLHHIIFSKISFITSLKSYILFFFILSFTLPFIIYKTLQTRFESLDQSKIILLSSIIVIFPVFQYSAIWGNNHITALIFLGIGIIFYNKFLQDFKLVNLIFSVIFFAFTCYTKQFYVFLFLFLIADIYNKIFLKDFIKVLILIFLCGLPGLFFVIQNPLLLFGFSQKVTNFPSSILISGSIIFFYLIPFIIQNFINLSGNLRSKLQFYLNTKILFLSAIILLLCIFSFKYNGSIGGGIFLKLSTLLTESYIIFYFTSILGIYFLYFFSNKNFSGLILATLLLITFSSGFFIFQKYFEPMIYIFFLNFFDKNLVLNSIKNSNLILIIYYTAYYIVLNYIYFFGL